MRLPFFSIVIPTYNRAHLISKAIESVLAQSFTDWELIIIDDGSTDNTKTVVENFPDSRIIYCWQENQERSAARNNGISFSKGEFICFLDSDDRWRKNHLQLLFEKINASNKKPAFYFTSMTWNFPDREQKVIFESPVGKNLIEYVITNQIAPSTVCIHSSILHQQKFDASLRLNEDVELFARIVASHQLIQIAEVTVDFTVHNENTKASQKNHISPQIEAMKIIFSNPVLKDKISSSFKKIRLRNLQHALTNYYFSTGEFSKMNKEIIRFLWLYPFDFQNKSKIVLLLYHLPGGSFIQKTIGKLK